MPSATSLDDLMAEIYCAGVKDPRKLNMLKRLITVYAWGIARSAEALEDVTPSFTPLEPGEWSMALEVTCCVKCTQVKRWDYFHVDQRHATGHKTTCKECRKKEDEQLGKPPYVPESVRRGGWLCISPPMGCGSRRKPEDFPEEKREKPRSAVLCYHCSPR